MSHRPQALPEFAVFCHSAGSLWMDLRTLHLPRFHGFPHVGLQVILKGMALLLLRLKQTRHEDGKPLVAESHARPIACESRKPRTFDIDLSHLGAETFKVSRQSVARFGRALESGFILDQSGDWDSSFPHTVQTCRSIHSRECKT
jgi:hypothetical protein